MEHKEIDVNTRNSGCATSHRFKWSPLSLNEIFRIAQQIRDGDGRKGVKDGERCVLQYII